MLLLLKMAPWLPLTVILFATTACAEVEVTTSSGAGPGATSGAGTTGAGGSTSGSGSGSGSSGSGAGGDTLTLAMTPFIVPSGGEVYKCQNFANPFGGVDAEVAKFESHMTAGSHHLLMFYKKNLVDSPISDCSGLEFAATPYSTQNPDDELTYPAGVAALIPPTTGLRLQSHYLNTTGQDLTAHVSITFHLAKSGTVTAHAGVLFVVEPSINIPPQQSGVVTHACKLPFDMNLIRATSHMHSHGTKFVASIAGQEVLNTTSWSEPKPTTWSPAKAVKGGDPLSFSCTFVNNTASPLTFGESAATNEMCIFGAPYYPVPSPSQVTVGCQ